MSTPSDIHSWLGGLGLGDHAELFVQNRITPNILHMLSNEDLLEIGISSIGDRKTILAAIAELSTPPILHAHSEPLPTRAPPTPSVVPPSPAANQPGRRRKAYSGSFITITVCVHLALILGAGYWVVQRVEAKRKLQFTSAPPTPNPSKRALEHKVSLQKKKNAGGAPAQAKRIAVTGLVAKITLPEMPSVPTTSMQLVTGRMAGMGGAGFGSGLGFGNGSGMGVGGMGAGGLGLTMFGTRGGSDGLIGTFYDLKQTKDRKPTDMAAEPGEGLDLDGPKAQRYLAILSQFIKSWNPDILSPYYTAPGKLAATQLFIPQLKADEAPKAFKVEKECEARRWLIHYRGEIVAPRDGTFRFVGSGDDVLILRLKGENVLDASFKNYKVIREVNGDDNVGPALKDNLVASKWIQMRRGEAMKVEVLVGEIPGGEFQCFLLIDEQGVEHPPGAFPIFQLRPGDIPTGLAPPHHGSIIFGSRAMNARTPLAPIKTR